MSTVSLAAENSSAKEISKELPDKGIRLCVHSSHDHRVKDFLEVLEFALTEQVGVEFRLAPEIITHLYYNRDTIDKLALLSKNGLPVQAHSHFTPGIGMDARRDLLSKTLDMADDMGLRTVTMHPSPYLDHLERYAFYMAPLIKTFFKHRVILAIENIPDYDAQTINRLFYQLQKRLDRFESKAMGMCLDVGHAHCMNRDPAVFVKALSSDISIVNVHVHDNSGTRDEHLKIGQGDIDFTATLAALFERYAGPMVLEYWDSDPALMKSALQEFSNKCQMATEDQPFPCAR